MDEKEAGDVLNSVIKSLSGLEEVARERVLDAVISFFGMQTKTEGRQSISEGISHPRSSANTNLATPQFSVDNSPSPKQFIMQKQPKTDVERVACLAYYLTHFREMPHFKTLEIAKLNTEAAQPKFSNTAYASNNATNLGYLVSASGGLRQLSASGEMFVQALPDREAAKASMASVRSRKQGKQPRKKQK